MVTTNVPDRNQPVKFSVAVPIVLDLCGMKVAKKDCVVDLGSYEFTAETWAVIERYQQLFQSEGLPVPSHVELAKLCMFWGIDQRELGQRLHTLRDQLHALKNQIIKPFALTSAEEQPAATTTSPSLRDLNDDGELL